VPAGKGWLILRFFAFDFNRFTQWPGKHFARPFCFSGSAHRAQIHIYELINSVFLSPAVARDEM
jgi:hypothetical protein